MRGKPDKAGHKDTAKNREYKIALATQNQQLNWITKKKGARRR